MRREKERKKPRAEDMKNPLKLLKRRIKYLRSDDYKYRKYWYSCPVNEKSIMIESGRGETVSGNMFAILKELRTAPEWKDYQVFFVVTEKSASEAKNKTDYYGLEDVSFVRRMSDEYLRLLASCKYFFTDNTYPTLFCKKENQILANTWHGTPLKHMGKKVLEGARGLNNVQRNYYMADYSLFPNDMTRDVFMDDYLLRHNYSGRLVMMDYPRNDAFHDNKMRETVRRELGIAEKRVYAYMPTWRGGDANSVSSDAQVDEIKGYLDELDSKLGEDEILLVNLHPFVAAAVNYDGFKHIRSFPREYETYDLLNACDALVTDYSSVMFDFAQTRRRIVLFTYDLEEYVRDRGMYIDIKELPFDICRSTDEVAAALSDERKPDYEDFLRRFCRYREDDTGCSGAFLDTVINGRGRTESQTREDRPLHVLAADSLSGGLSDELRKAIEKRSSEGMHVTVLFEGGVKPEVIPALREIDSYDNVDYYSLIGGIRNDDMPREVRRIFPGWKVTGFNTIGKLRRPYFRLVHHLIPVRTYSLSESGNDIVIKFRQKDISYLDHAVLCDNEYALEKNGDRYRIAIPKSDLVGFKYRNQISLIDIFGTEHKIIFASKLAKVLRIIHTKLLSFNSIVCYLQEYINRTDLVVREPNYTDGTAQQIKIAIAYGLAKISGRGKLPIILYEKNSRRYEESASVLYEKLIDSGYNNAYYVIEKGCPAWDDVPEKYRRNLLPKYSFRHYYNLFRTQTVLATETVTHNIDLRPVSPFLRYWLKHGRFNYVFLQHGVMYMISLDSETRAFFKLEKRPGFVNRIVVSSQLEAEHFIYRGNVKPEELYVCGLLKFDRAVRNDVHDRIVIMPTWRPWEAVQAAEDFRKTSYYRFIEKIYNAVPDGLKDRVIILPHPLIKQYAVDAYEQGGKDNADDVVRLMQPDVTYEEILRMTDTLITDYSSISYDAFYRGANVIFDWEEKDDTVAEYGKTARLMLTEDLAFGNVCRSAGELTEAVKSVYGRPHSDEYEKRFSKIVEFHDGHNTDRFIEMIKKDGILK